ncbi:hypothetical protein ACFOEL_18405 [Virgibacillus litoralis]
MGGFGFLAFLLGIIGQIQPLSFHENPDGRLAHNFILTFSNDVHYFSDIMLIRVAGYFDEPGAFAFYIVICLLLNKIIFNNKRIEFLLIFIGIFTFSLSFFIILVFYLIFFYFLQNITLKRISFLGLVLVLFLFFSTLLINFHDKSPVLNILYSFTFERLELSTGDETSIIKGDNRTGLLINAYYAFLDSPLIGQGQSYIDDKSNEFYQQKTGSNPFGPLATDGLIGSILFFLPIIYLAYIIFFYRSFINVKSAKIFILLIILLLQRPVITDVLTYLLIIALILLLKKSKIEITEINEVRPPPR